MPGQFRRYLYQRRRSGHIRRGLERCGPLLQKFGERVWVIPGNHESAGDNEEFCARFGLVNFHRQTRQLGATQWAGLGYSNPTPFDTPGEYTEEQIAEALEKFRGLSPLYLVAHVPPHGSKLDEFAPGKHAGSTALRAWIEREQPDAAIAPGRAVGRARNREQWKEPFGPVVTGWGVQG